MKTTPKKRKSRLVETEDGRLLIKSPMAYVYLLLPLAFLCVFVLTVIQMSIGDDKEARKDKKRRAKEAKEAQKKRRLEAAHAAMGKEE